MIAESKILSCKLFFNDQLAVFSSKMQLFTAFWLLSSIAVSNQYKLVFTFHQKASYQGMAYVVGVLSPFKCYNLPAMLQNNTRSVNLSKRNIYQLHQGKDCSGSYVELSHSHPDLEQTCIGKYVQSFIPYSHGKERYLALRDLCI